MHLENLASRTLCGLRVCLSSLALAQLSMGATVASAIDSHDRSGDTRSPIKHVIVIIGEKIGRAHV